MPAWPHFPYPLFRTFSWLPLAVSVAELVPTSALGWTPGTQIAILRDAVRTLPHSEILYWQQCLPYLEAGVLEPLRGTPATEHHVDELGQGELPQAFRRELLQALALWLQTADSEASNRQLGRTLHFLNDANFPLNAGAGDPREGSYFEDFARYVDSARHRFVLVERSPRLRLLEAEDFFALFTNALKRSREFYPAVGREYRRIQFGVGRLQFDDRSTAFAVAALSYHHAVADTREVLLAFRYRNRRTMPNPLTAFGQEVYVSREPSN